ncbi:MAG: SCO family protein [Anaerolineae bacterium]|nr:SCO family protein [Anaerolineae bacterium]
MTLNHKFLLGITAIVLGMFLAGCQLGQYEYKGGLIDPPIQLPDFELTATDGHPFHLSDVEGDIALLYFGYTYCPDVCPLTMWEVKKALAELETGRERIHVIFISVDPERDTPEVLANYMNAFGPEFMGLTDDFAKIQEMMKSYGAFAEKEAVSDSALGYLVNHTARLYLIDPQQQLLLQYPFGFTAEDLTSDLEYLIQREGL